MRTSQRCSPAPEAPCGGMFRKGAVLQLCGPGRRPPARHRVCENGGRRLRAGEKSAGHEARGAAVDMRDPPLLADLDRGRGHHGTKAHCRTSPLYGATGSRCARTSGWTMPAEVLKGRAPSLKEVSFASATIPSVSFVHAFRRATAPRRGKSGWGLSQALHVKRTPTLRAWLSVPVAISPSYAGRSASPRDGGRGLHATTAALRSGVAPNRVKELPGARRNADVIRTGGSRRTRASRPSRTARSSVRSLPRESSSEIAPTVVRCGFRRLLRHVRLRGLRA